MSTYLAMFIFNVWQFLYFVFHIPSSTSTFAFRLFTSPYYSYNCEVQKATSLLQCANRCSQDGGVTFFHHPIDMKCRWNCTAINEERNLEDGWRHYEGYWKRNAALHKASASSSIWPWDSHLYHAGYAVDGRIVNDTSSRQCFLSNFERSPWFQVDMHGDYMISFLRLFYRMDGTGNEFHDISVQVCKKGWVFEICGFFKGPGIMKQVADVLCKTSDYVRFVRLQITAASYNALLLCEVEVYTLN